MGAGQGTDRQVGRASDQYRADQNRSDKAETGGDAAGGDAAGGNAAGADGGLVCGVGTDQLRDGERYPVSRIIGAYAEQMAFVQATGAGVVLMASRALAASARGARDYLDVYGELLRQAERPVILHWLGEAFDPALRGYWGSGEFSAAADTVLELIDRAGGRVDGVKLSVLDAGHEVALRRRLPAGVRLYTGDDFNYADLIRGDAQGHSDALLGAFAAITGPAAAALAALDRGDLLGYDAAIAPTVPLSRLLFEQPTYHYKVGVAFLAWLNGLQPHFAMLGGLERRAADRASDPGLRAGGRGAGPSGAGTCSRADEPGCSMSRRDLPSVSVAMMTQTDERSPGSERKCPVGQQRTRREPENVPECHGPRCGRG